MALAVKVTSNDQFPPTTARFKSEAAPVLSPSVQVPLNATPPASLSFEPPTSELDDLDAPGSLRVLFVEEALRSALLETAPSGPIFASQPGPLGDLLRYSGPSSPLLPC